MGPRPKADRSMRETPGDDRHKTFTTRPCPIAVNRRYVAGGLLVAGVIALAWTTSPTAALDALAWLAADPVRFGIALVALAAVRPFLAWPTTLVAVAVGFGYGWVGLPLAVLLLTLTALPPYWLAGAGRPRLARGAGTLAGASDAVDRFVADAGGVRAIAATRFLPVPADAVSVAAGVAGVRLRPFLAGTAIGEFPWAVVGIAIGVSVDRLARNDLSTADPTLLVATALVGVLLLAGPVYRAVSNETDIAGT